MQIQLQTQGAELDGTLEDESELFSEDFQAGYVKNLLRIQGNPVKLPDSSEHYDIYLAKELYPVLLPGIELLSREIFRLTDKESKGKCLNSIHLTSLFASRQDITLDQTEIQSMHFLG